MVYRITFGFSGMGTGWGETHAMISNLNNPKDLVGTLTDVAQKRAQMLGREFAINAIRIARYATDAGARQRGVYLLKQIFRNSNQTAAYAAEPASVAYLVRGSAEPSILNPAFDANQNQTFLGGPINSTVDNAGEVDTGKAGLLASFGSWRSIMISAQLGWLASQTLIDEPIVSIAQNVNGTIKFTFAAGALAALTVGTKYKARVRQVNQGVSPLNGEVIVSIASATEANSVEVIGIATPQVNGAMRFYKQVQPFVDYGDLVLAATTAKHKRGRPFGSSPGRAKRRIRG